MKIQSLLLSSLLLLGVAPIPPASTQQEICRDEFEIEPSDNLRTLELPQFGIDIDIPANYRAIALNDGSVRIYDPGTYEIIACLHRGGIASVPRGIRSFTINLVGNPRNLPLPALIEQEEGAFQSRHRYNLNGTPVFVTEPPGIGISAWFAPPRARGIVSMYDSCECQPLDSDIFTRLNSTRLR